MPADQPFAFLISLIRPIGGYLYGRKTYEATAVWEPPAVLRGGTPATMEFASIWQTSEKIVCSQSLKTVSLPPTRLDREFRPQAVREGKAKSSLDLAMGGPTLAADRLRTGLVDEYHMLIVPALLGRGTPVHPVNLRLRLDLLDERRFSSGWVYLRYRILA
ncbi:MAG: dihydrofolate reductase family protein [Acidobacteriota bacterium]